MNTEPYRLMPGEHETRFALCDTCGRHSVDAIEDPDGYHSKLDDAIADYRKGHSRQDISNLHVVTCVYTNEGPLGQYQAKAQAKEAKPIPEVEHPTGGTVEDLNNVLETVDLVLSMTMEAMGRRLMDEDLPASVQCEGLTLLMTVRYLQRLTEHGIKLELARRQLDEPEAATA